MFIHKKGRGGQNEEACMSEIGENQSVCTCVCVCVCVYLVLAPAGRRRAGWAPASQTGRYSPAKNAERSRTNLSTQRKRPVSRTERTSGPSCSYLRWTSCCGLKVDLKACLDSRVLSAIVPVFIDVSIPGGVSYTTTMGTQVHHAQSWTLCKLRKGSWLKRNIILSIVGKKRVIRLTWEQENNMKRRYSRGVSPVKPLHEWSIAVYIHAIKMSSNMDRWGQEDSPRPQDMHF